MLQTVEVDEAAVCGGGEGGWASSAPLAVEVTLASSISESESSRSAAICSISAPSAFGDPRITFAMVSVPALTLFNLEN